VFFKLASQYGIVIVTAFGLSASQAQDLPSDAKDFFEQYCIKCHGEQKRKGKITLHDFPYQAAGANHLKLWENVLDTLKSNDMPPDDEAQPTDEERKKVATWLDNGLKRQMREHPAPPTTTALTRRLTNFEYQNTLRDLLGIELDVIADLPQDPNKPYHFHNTAEYMLIGQEQIDRYLETARRILASTIVSSTAPKVIKKRVEWSDKLGHQNGMSNNAVGLWGNHRQSAAMGITIADPPTTGEFLLRFQASAKLLDGAVEVPLRFIMGYTIQVNSSTQRVAPIGTVHLSQETPQVFEMRGRLENFPVQPPTSEKNRVTPPSFHVTPLNLYDDGTLNDGVTFARVRNAQMPQALIDWVEFEGPYFETWPPDHHKRIMLDSPLRESDPRSYARLVLKFFLPRAFRRPATEEEVERFGNMFDLIFPSSASLEEAMRETLAMVLISPQFLYHTVADGKTVAPSYELASRLSYFLWGSMPDEELLRLASSNQLSDSTIMEQQVLRLLADPRAEGFVKNFTMQWLSLAKMRTVPINQDLFPRFLYVVAFGERKGTEEPYRPTVRDFMVEETIAYVAELIRSNGKPMQIIDSDFAMLNQRLAAHYGVSDVHGMQLRRVPVRPEHRIGGLLTQGSVLIGNATGTAPHPIYRAVWLREAILGEYVAPPPAEVPALADTAGTSAEKALSIKDLLVKHRTVEACNDCHARLDPWGIPFEHYNAIGQYQPLVPKEGTRIKPLNDISEKGRHDYQAYLQSINTVPIEADSRLPKGPQVLGMADLKRYLTQERSDDITRNLIRRLTTYAIGRELTVHDRNEIETLLARARKEQVGMRDIIIHICQSPIFRSPADASSTKQ
jgi:hypothetical protein